MTKVAIITSAHWEGDARLLRHVRYLGQAGHDARLTSCADRGRMAAVLCALREVWRSNADVVLLPDPELFAVGSLLARLRVKRAVIDIHEDYAQAAMARPWVPVGARDFIRVFADLAVRLGRLAAWRVMVAADELARSNDFVSLNIPDPSTLEFGEHDGSKRLVYVGDLTRARGAADMIDLLAGLDSGYELRLIGSANPEFARELNARAERLGVAGRVEVTGRLAHGEAWAAARGSLAGLNLLRPVPAYRNAVATKLWEYLAVGVPPIVTDLPGQARLIHNVDASLVCSSVSEMVDVITALGGQSQRRADLGERGRRVVEEAWNSSRPDLVVQAVVEP